MIYTYEIGVIGILIRAMKRCKENKKNLDGGNNEKSPGQYT